MLSRRELTNALLPLSHVPRTHEAVVFLCLGHGYLVLERRPDQGLAFQYAETKYVVLSRSVLKSHSGAEVN